MRIGSLFSGAGGLDMAVQSVFGGEIVWHSEIDKAASKVLEYRFPGVPNLGDITKIDWSWHEPVDVLCGGFPCTDVSAAGKRAGMHGTRSGLWSHMAEAIDVLRPRFVVIENVRGLLNANANRPMESEQDAVGNPADRPVLRAIGAVLGDLADIGIYEARWVTVAASSVGAPHRRERVFILATDSERGSGARIANAGRHSEADREGRQTVLAGRFGDPASLSGGAAVGQHPGGTSAAQTRQDSSHRSGDYRGERTDVVGLRREYFSAVQAGDYLTARQIQEELDVAEPGVALLPTPNASDGSGGGQHPDKREGHSRQLIDSVLALPLLQTPQARDGKGLPGQGFNEGNLLSQVIEVTPSTDGGWCEQCWVEDRVSACRADEYGYPVANWGKYAPAIARWEQIVGPAPAPTEPNKNGNPRLSAAFSQWLMGWPAGWVTDPDIGISRNDQLRIVGNGVCPQQAASALRHLIAV